jgi:predicted transcriptional regulator
MRKYLLAGMLVPILTTGLLAQSSQDLETVKEEPQAIKGRLTELCERVDKLMEKITEQCRKQPSTTMVDIYKMEMKRYQPTVRIHAELLDKVAKGLKKSGPTVRIDTRQLKKTWKRMKKSGLNLWPERKC